MKRMTILSREKRLDTTQLWIERCLWLPASALLLLGFQACIQNTGAPEETSATLAALEDTASPEKRAKRPITSGPSPQAVSISWDNTEKTARANLLAATLRNNTSDKIKVELEVWGRGPTGHSATRSLGERVLKANSSQTVRVPVGNLPIQSVGASSIITIVARYRGAAINAFTGEPVTPPMLETFATHRYVTMNDDFRQATIRTEQAQAEANVPAYKGGRREQLRALRVLDPSTKTVVSISTDDVEQTENPVIEIVALTPDHPEYEAFEAQRAQDN